MFYSTASSLPVKAVISSSQQRLGMKGIAVPVLWVSQERGPVQEQQERGHQDGDPELALCVLLGTCLVSPACLGKKGAQNASE